SWRLTLHNSLREIAESRCGYIRNSRVATMSLCRVLMLIAIAWCIVAAGRAAEPARSNPASYQQGDLAGSLRSAAPLTLYSADPESLANRLVRAVSRRHTD